MIDAGLRRCVEAVRYFLYSSLAKGGANFFFSALIPPSPPFPNQGKKGGDL